MREEDYQESIYSEAKEMSKRARNLYSVIKSNFIVPM